MLLALSLLLRASVRGPEKQTPFDRLVIRIVAPVQAAMHGVLRRVGQVWSGYVALWGVQRENEALQHKNAEQAARLLRLETLHERNRQLETLLDLRSQVLADTAVARVIAVETSRQFRVVRLRIEREGVDLRPGMPVLSAEGVVGKVGKVVGPYADVVLLSDARSAIDVVIPNADSRGVLKGTGDEKRYLCRMEYALKKEPIEKGQAVLTSGLSGSFPRELPVGRVVSVRKNDASLYQEIEVEPVVSFAHLREVLVVLSPPPPPEKEVGKSLPDPARGPGVPR